MLSCCLRVDQNAGIQNSARIQHPLGGPQRQCESLGTLAVITRPMVAANRMMMGYCPARFNYRIHSDLFNCVPLFEFCTGTGRSEHRIVRCRSIRVDMSKATGHHSLPTYALDRIADTLQDAAVK